MPNWEVATALGIALLVALTTHVFYRRPPAALWPVLPLVFGSALIFSVGDLVANLWAQNETVRWVGGVQQLYASAVRTFVEVGPSGVLSGLVEHNISWP